ncbi:IclR family transcriptional regulator [Arthrobacter sp. B2a2-09]|uniref:IclR family transcriptional regulator n=1 Tax=Arthrobacter sp. B2a2-09 TaxID=2952822 RepID=UPI0022CD2C5C|nr:IclR family transcriptional regulator [Arthrobacter sp. B2a2-09]MCZ9882295.1 IclR family transcriptional regulator [Arthrobacter sp. B2a2-09]
MTLQSLTERPEELDEKSSPLEKTFAVLEFVAERGGATAKEVSDSLGYPVPSVYRLAKALVQAGYLVHLKDKSRFELGYKPHQLAVSLHRQIGVPSAVKGAIVDLHQRVAMAAYFAVYRGADVVVAYIVDSPEHPRLQPLSFGFHEAAHATAFGKIMLAGMNEPQRDQYLAVHGTRPLQEATITDMQELSAHLDSVMLDGIAWEHEEFVPGKTCAAVGVRNGAGMVVGSVAVSADTDFMKGRERQVEISLRETANMVSKYFRTGAAR